MIILIARVMIVVYIDKSRMLDFSDPTKNGVAYAKINANPRSTLDRYTSARVIANPVLSKRAKVANPSEIRAVLPVIMCLPKRIVR